MILTCPACGTQYVVKDGAIPEGGRKVRCASCRHSWHQDPSAEAPLELEESMETDAPMAAEPAETGGYDEGETAADYGAAAAMESVEHGYSSEERDYSDDAPGETREPPAAEAAWGQPEATGDVRDAAAPYALAPSGAAAAAAAPDDVDDDFSPFADRTPAGRSRRSPLVAVLAIVILVAALAAAFWFLAPAEWKARIGLTAAGQTPLQLMMTHSDRQALASGNELLAVSGRVINPTRNAQRVPPIQAELRSSDGKLVYRWTIAPPTQTLGPGASARFNSAEVNVPAGGEELTVSLGAPGA